MKKNKIVWLFVLSLLGFISGYVVLNSNIEVNNTGYLLVKAGKALFYGMGALAIVFLFLIFTPGAVGAWKKFARWYIPIAALIFIFYPNPGSGDLFSPYPEQIFQWVSAIYVTVSVLIIILSKRPNLPIVIK